MWARAALRTGGARSWGLAGVAGVVAAATVAATATTRRAETAQKPPPPPSLVRLTRENDAAVAHDAAPETVATASSDGTKWHKAVEGDGIAVWWSEVKNGNGTRRWRVEADGFYGVTTQIARELHDFSKRTKTPTNPTGWDSTMAWGNVLGSFSGAESASDEWYDVLHYATAPAGGGLVSSRDFVQGVWYKILPNTGLRMGICSADTYALKKPAYEDMVRAMPRLGEINNGLAGCIRGTLMSGCGVEIIPLDPKADPAKPRMHRYVVLSHSDAGGWLPVSLLNQVTADTMKASVANFRAHVRRLWPPPSPASSGGK